MCLNPVNLKKASEKLKDSPVAIRVLTYISELELKTCSFQEVQTAAKLQIAKTGNKLVDFGLVQSLTRRHTLAWVAGIVTAGVLAVGIIRIIQAVENAKPFGFLVAEMAIVGLLFIAAIWLIPLRTIIGDKVACKFRKKIKKINKSKLVEQKHSSIVGLMVAALGTSCLVGTPWSSRSKEISAFFWQSDGSGDGDGGSGCGGCGGRGG
ncbi:MAG: TIGR04222 domain-containing membrane protein [Planctomycetota bacterium]